MAANAQATLGNSAALAKLASLYPTPPASSEAKEQHARKEGKRTTAGGGVCRATFVFCRRRCLRRRALPPLCSTLCSAQ